MNNENTKYGVWITYSYKKGKRRRYDHWLLDEQGVPYMFSDYARAEALAEYTAEDIRIHRLHKGAIRLEYGESALPVAHVRGDME